MTVGELIIVGGAVKTYNTRASLDNDVVIEHSLAHIIAAGLTYPDQLMDFEAAKRFTPNYRIAGYEAEPIASLYEAFISNYPASSFKWFNKECTFEDVISVIQNTTKQFLAETLERDQTAIDKAKYRNEPLHTYIEGGNEAHKKKRVEYVLSNDPIIMPSDKEMLFHLGKARELCESFKKARGEYPSYFIRKEGPDELASLPLRFFEIDNRSPWSKRYQQE